MVDWLTILGVFVVVCWGLFSAAIVIPYFVVRKLKKGGYEKSLVDIGTGILAKLKQGGPLVEGDTSQGLEAVLSQIDGALKPNSPPKGHAAKGTMQGGMDPNLMGSIGGLVKKLQADPEMQKNLMDMMPGDMKQGVMTDGIKDLVPPEYRKYVKNPLVQMFLEKIMTNMMQKQLSGGNSPITSIGSGATSMTKTQYKKVI